MRRPSQRQRPTREQTRERVLDAAVALFFERGPAATTLDAVADRAGLTKGAIYSSFGSKDELFAATVERLPTRMFTDAFPPGASTKDEARDALRRIGELAARAQPPDDAVALLHELYAVALRSTAARETVSTWVAAMVEEAAAARGEDSLTLNVAYRDMWVVAQALIEGLMLRRAINPELVNDELMVRAVELLVGFVE